jgi:predicted deacetylase
MLTPKLLLSLHDVTPCHTRRLASAERVFLELGVTRVTYLFVPRYHGAWDINDDLRFLDWCRGSRPFTVRWCLHGYHHQEMSPGGSRSVRNWFERRLLTAGEGEFLDLRGSELRQRIDCGRAAFRSCFGIDPTGFVAPAWLFNQALLPALRDRGFTWTEDQRRLHLVQAHQAIEAPVITWAPRTVVRRYSSMLLAPALLRLWSGRPVIRIAVHPLDFDHAPLVDAIRRLIATALQQRVLADYEEVLGERSAQPTV